MRRVNISLFSFLAVVSCLIFLVIAIYERDRANEIESKSIVITSPEYLAIIDQDWDIMKRELQLKYAMQKLEENNVQSDLMDDGVSAGNINFRRELANIRNSKLKLSREKNKLENMRNAIIKNSVDSSGNER